MCRYSVTYRKHFNNDLNFKSSIDIYTHTHTCEVVQPPQSYMYTLHSLCHVAKCKRARKRLHQRKALTSVQFADQRQRPYIVSLMCMIWKAVYLIHGDLNLFWSLFTQISNYRIQTFFTSITCWNVYAHTHEHTHRVAHEPVSAVNNASVTHGRRQANAECKCSYSVHGIA